MAELFKYNELNIDEVDFSVGSEFEDCEFYGINLVNQSLKSVSFYNCKFKDCNLGNQSLTNASIRETVFESCNLIGINWCAAKRLESLFFKDSKLNFSTFQGLKLKRSKIIDCTVLDVDFSGADLTFSEFTGSDLAGANFEGATLNEVNFRGSRHYMFDLRTAKIQGAKFDVPHVLSLISALGADVEF